MIRPLHDPSPTVTLRAGGVIAILFAATFIIMVGCVVAPALPSIASHLGMERHPGWLVTLPALGVTLFGPATGWLSARGVSARTAMLGGLFAYGVIGMVTPLLRHWPLLVVVDRLLLGAATAVLMASNTGLIASFSRGARRLKMIAWQGMATEAGGILLLAVGGMLGSLSWQLPFLLYGLAFVCVVLVHFFIPSLPLIDEEVADTSPETSKGVKVALVSATLSMTLFFVAVLILPTTLSKTLRVGPAGVGYVLSYISLCAVLCISVLPKTLKYIRPGLLQCIAFVMYGVSHLTFAASRNLPAVLLAGLLMGCAFAFSIPLSTHLVIELSAAPQRARNLGYLSTCIFFGQVLSSFASYISTSGRVVMVVTGCAGILFAVLRWLREMIVTGQQATA